MGWSKSYHVRPWVFFLRLSSSEGFPFLTYHSKEGWYQKRWRAHPSSHLPTSDVTWSWERDSIEGCQSAKSGFSVSFNLNILGSSCSLEVCVTVRAWRSTCALTSIKIYLHTQDSDSQGKSVSVWFYSASLISLWASSLSGQYEERMWRWLLCLRAVLKHFSGIWRSKIVGFHLRHLFWKTRHLSKV